MRIADRGAPAGEEAAALGVGALSFQWGSIADEPDVAEGIDEAALAMDAPRRGVVANLVAAAVGAGANRA